jgi:hypothetical protein
MTLAAGTKLGPYEIVAPIGAGGMGEVYRANDSRLDRQVAGEELTLWAGRRRRGPDREGKIERARSLPLQGPPYGPGRPGDGAGRLDAQPV